MLGTGLRYGEPALPVVAAVVPVPGVPPTAIPPTVPLPPGAEFPMAPPTANPPTVLLTGVAPTVWPPTACPPTTPVGSTAGTAPIVVPGMAPAAPAT